MTPAPLDFWFDFASTYSHPAHCRIGALAAAHGVAVRWRPFLLGPIFAEQGLTNSPFMLYAPKGAYMWHDLARECAKFGVPWRRPSAFPRRSALAARVAVAHADVPWLPAYCRAVSEANFVHDQDIGEAAVLQAVLNTLGQDGAACLARTALPAMQPLLRAATDEARALGIFGAPTFVVRSELFWGHDRMADAFNAARAASPAASPPPRS